MAAGLSLLEGSTELGGRAGPSLLSACLMGMSAKGAFVPGSKPLSPRAGVLWLRGHVPVKPVGLWQRGRLPVGRWRRALSVVGEAHEDRRGRCCLGLIPEPAGTLLSPPGRTYVLKLLDGCGEAPGGGHTRPRPLWGGRGNGGGALCQPEHLPRSPEPLTQVGDYSMRMQALRRTWMCFHHALYSSFGASFICCWVSNSALRLCAGS